MTIHIISETEKLISGLNKYMTRKKVSVVLPVFNAAGYLDRCMESIVNQTLTDIEMILVEGCSTDNSYALCREWAAKDPRIILRQNESNIGVSETRNRGLDLATGEYILFLDSDDYIDLTLFEKAYNKIKETEADALVYGFCVTNDSFVTPVTLDTDRELFCGEDIRKILYPGFLLNPHYIIGAAWTEMISLDFLRETHLRFTSELTVGEDAYFNLLLFSKTQRVAVIPDGMYYYNIANTQQATKIFNEARISNARHYRGTCLEQYEALGYDEKTKHSVNSHYILMITSLIPNLLSSADNYSDEELKRYFRLILSDPTYRELAGDEAYREVFEYFCYLIFSGHRTDNDAFNRTFTLPLLEQIKRGDTDACMKMVRDCTE